MFDRTLQSYVPSYYDKVVEMDAIIAAEQPMMTAAHRETTLAFTRGFVLTADVVGIEVFEQMLGIVADPSIEDLEFRRGRVLNRMSMRLPFTYRYLVNKLNQFLGVGQYEIELDHNSYSLKIVAHTGIPNKIEELVQTLYKIVPVNIILVAKNEIICYITSELFLAAAISPAFHYQITSNFKKTYTPEGNAHYAGAIDPLLHFTLTSDFSKDYGVSGNEKFAGAPDIGSHIELTGDFKKTYGIQSGQVIGGVVSPNRSYELGQWAAWHQTQGVAHQGGVATPAHKYVLKTFDHVYDIGTPSHIAGVAEKVSQVELTVNSTSAFQVASPSYAAGAVVKGTRVELTMSRDIHLEMEGHQFSAGAIVGALRTHLTTQANKTYSALNREYQGGAVGRGFRMSLTMGDDKSYEAQGEAHQEGTASLNTTYHID